MCGPQHAGWLSFGGALLAALFCIGAAAADDLGMLMGPRFRAESLGGHHFGQLLGGRNIEGELGVHALRQRQALQEHERRFTPLYNQRFRGGAGRRGRTPWPNSEIPSHVRGGPTWEGAKAACHPVIKSGRDDKGRRRAFSGTRCYDDYGQPHVLERGFEAREYR